MIKFVTDNEGNSDITLKAFFTINEDGIDLRLSDGSSSQFLLRITSQGKLYKAQLTEEIAKKWGIQTDVNGTIKLDT